MPPARLPHNQHTVRFPNSKRYAASARHAVMGFALACGLTGDAYDDLRIAVGEAIAHAVEHGYRDRSYFCVRCWRESGWIVVEVESGGKGFDSQCFAEGSAERGYGTALMRSLVDRVTFDRDGSSVRLYKALRGAGDAENLFTTGS